MKRIVFTSLVVLALVFLSSCSHLKMFLNVPSGGVMEDTILIASTNGAPPREVEKLGDIDLTQTELTFAYNLDEATSTHWWLIGHRGGQVVYTSVGSLGGVDLHSVEPYDVASPADWNIPANLDAYVAGGTYSLDWWVQTVNNHASHVAADTAEAGLWQFGTAGSNIGTITISLHED